MYLLSAYDTGSICSSGIPQLHVGTVVAHTDAPYSIGYSVQRMGSSFIGLAADLIWRPALGILHPFPLMLLSSLIIVWVCEPIRRRFFIH